MATVSVYLTHCNYEGIRRAASQTVGLRADSWTKAMGLNNIQRGIPPNQAIRADDDSRRL